MYISSRVWTTQIDVSAIVLTVANYTGTDRIDSYAMKLPEKWNKRFTWALFMITPWISFYMVEKVFYNPISVMNKLAFGLNVLWYYIVYMICCLYLTE